MTKRFVCKILLLSAILLLAAWPAACAQSGIGHIARQDSVRITLAGPSVASDLSNAPESSQGSSRPTIKIRERADNNTGSQFPFRLYVTPEDQAIQALANQINGAEDAYKVAVQWVYVSDQKLNYIADKWLTPHQFLADTPHYPGNPVEGKEVSDCEEQAQTLASLIRAEGVPPEEVRVALGQAKFGNAATGHAWVELLTNGHWLALDPSWGPYWDDKAGKLVSRRGVPFDYYASHTYPVVQVWVYYNDIYCLDLRDGSGNAPAWWRQGTPPR